MKSTSEQRQGVIWTIAVHLLLLLALYFVALRTPLPLPGEDGVEIRMGDSEEGTFSEQEDISLSSTPVAQQPTQSQEEIITATDEESVAIEPKITPKPRRQETPVSEPKPEPPKPEPKPTVDPRAMYTGGGSGSGTAGTGTTGNLGRPDGTSPTGGLSGGGSGSGSGQGFGQGVDGQGTGFFLQGRGKVSLQKPQYNSGEQGRIVVEIMVDRNGAVVSATAGKKVPDSNIGTTISDQSMWKEAEKAAMQSKFSKDEKAAERQKGYIVYNFVKLSE